MEGIEQEAETNPAMFVFFDILVYNGKDIKNQSYQERQKVITQFNRESLLSRPACRRLLVMTTAEEKQSLWDQTIGKKREGVMAKHIKSPYAGRRSDSWIKFKRKQTVDVIVTEWIRGTGKLSGKETESIIGTDITIRDENGTPIEVFGALVCAVMKNGKMVEIGNVGGGFSNEDRRNITRQFLKPEGAVRMPFVIEVETYGLAARKMRMAQFLRMREDKAPQDCEMKQFE